MFCSWNADIVGQGITPEVYLAREIGACYSGIYMVVYHAEGIIRDWKHKT
jgi:5'-methylthioadenosine phosphorylase